MIFKTTRYLLLGLGASLFISAQEPAISFGLKMGTGLGMASGNKEQASNLSLHLALTGQYRLDSKTSLIGEAKYVYFRAMQWDYPFPKDAALEGYFEDGTKGYISMRSSVISRKNDLDGLALVLGYKRAIADTKWYWQAGLNIYYLKSYDQALGQINIYVNEHDADHWDGYIGGDDFESITKLNGSNSIKPGIFAGIHGYISENVFVEANLQSVAFDQVLYQPHMLTGKPSTAESYSRNKVVLEFSAGFRF
ncbi:MAG: hypothetical protein LBH03_00565 [Holophagales bacterium]|jgi:hypothetical protein|nr:hypothetical protein [Holophagales bacterium]